MEVPCVVLALARLLSFLWVVRVLLVGWVAGGGDGIFSRLRLFSLRMRWGMEVFGTMTGVLNISSDTRTGVIKH
jgi:hypothetical protein